MNEFIELTTSVVEVFVLMYGLNVKLCIVSYKVRGAAGGQRKSITRALLYCIQNIIIVAEKIDT